MEGTPELSARQFELTAMAHTESLIRVAIRLTGARSHAEDLVQDTLLRAWRAFHQFESGANCKAWLFRILYNQANENLRRGRRAPVTVQIDGPEELNWKAARPDSANYSSSELMSTLDSLPGDQRAVLILIVLEGFTCRETGEILGVLIGTVMSRLSRARAGMREMLSGSTANADRTQTYRRPEV